MRTLLESGAVRRVTTSTINPHAMGQHEIDAAVKASVAHGTRPRRPPRPS